MVLYKPLTSVALTEGYNPQNVTFFTISAQVSPLFTVLCNPGTKCLYVKNFRGGGNILVTCSTMAFFRCVYKVVPLKKRPFFFLSVH